MNYKAERNNGGKIETFEDFASAAEWVADGVAYDTAENGENGSYIYAGGTEDCLGAVDEIEAA